MMYHILVPVDKDRESAVKRAEMLAEMPFDTDRIKVTILNVFEEFDGVSGDLQMSSNDIYDESRFPESVTEVKQRLETAGIDLTLIRQHGNPADEIIAYAQEAECDLIIMGGRKRSPVGKAVFGSVSQNVLLNSKKPVTVLTSG